MFVFWPSTNQKYLIKYFKKISKEAFCQKIWDELTRFIYSLICPECVYYLVSGLTSWLLILLYISVVRCWFSFIVYIDLLDEWLTIPYRAALVFFSGNFFGYFKFNSPMPLIFFLDYAVHCRNLFSMCMHTPPQFSYLKYLSTLSRNDLLIDDVPYSESCPETVAHFPFFFRGVNRSSTFSVIGGQSKSREPRVPERDPLRCHLLTMSP